MLVVVSRSFLETQYAKKAKKKIDEEVITYKFDMVTS